MRKITLLLAVLFSAVFSGSAADDLRALTEKLASSRVSFTYAYEAVRDGIVMKGSGTAMLQGEAFRMEGNGLEIVSDGEVRWTADSETRELFIEPVDAAATDFVSNPARLLADIGKAFSFTGSKPVTFRGQATEGYVLEPVVRDSGIRQLVLCLSGQTLVGASVTVKDGTVTEFLLSDMVFSAPGPADDFRFDEKKTGNGWVVTDLR